MSGIQNFYNGNYMHRHKNDALEEATKTGNYDVLRFSPYSAEENLLIVDRLAEADGTLISGIVCTAWSFQIFQEGVLAEEIIHKPGAEIQYGKAKVKTDLRPQAAPDQNETTFQNTINRSRTHQPGATT